MVKVIRGAGGMQTMKQLHKMKLCTKSCFICLANRKKKADAIAQRKKKRAD